MCGGPIVSAAVFDGWLKHCHGASVQLSLFSGLLFLRCLFQHEESSTWIFP